MTRIVLAAAVTVALSSAAPSPAPAAPAGIDVSRFEGPIGWARTAAAGVDFAFVQASRGSGADCSVKPNRCGADPRYAYNRLRAREEGIRVGPYHRAFVNGASLYAAKRDARREAALFAAQVGSLQRGDLLPVLDFEAPFGGLDPRRLRGWVRTWLAQAELRLGVKPMIYTNLSSWRATGDTAAFALAGHRLWVANWGVDLPLVPADDWAGQGWSVWQYTNRGRVDGVRGRVSLDRLGVPLRRLAAGGGGARGESG